MIARGMLERLHERRQVTCPQLQGDRTLDAFGLAHASHVVAEVAELGEVRQIVPPVFE